MADETHEDLGTWQLRSEGMLMRAEGTNAGNLVRLSRVVRWLMIVRELPRSNAVQQVAAGLIRAPETQLFRVRVERYAEPLNSDTVLLTEHDRAAARRPAAVQRTLVLSEHDVEWLRRENAGSKYRLAFLAEDMAPSPPPPPPPPPPAPAAVIAANYIDREWRDVRRSSIPGMPPILGDWDVFDPMNSGDKGGDLAVRVTDAQALWGWGEVDALPASPFPLPDWAALVTYRLANKGASWADGNQIELGKAEYQARGGDAPGRKAATLAAMASELGVSRQSLQSSLWGERNRKAHQASPLPSADTPWRSAG